MKMIHIDFWLISSDNLDSSHQTPFSPEAAPSKHLHLLGPSWSCLTDFLLDHSWLWHRANAYLFQTVCCGSKCQVARCLLSLLSPGRLLFLLFETIIPSNKTCDLLRWPLHRVSILLRKWSMLHPETKRSPTGSMTGLLAQVQRLVCFTRPDTQSSSYLVVS